MHTPPRAGILAALLAVTPLGAVALAAAPAFAADGPTVCTFEYNPDLSPGLTMDPGAGKVTSHGETGVVRCDGTVNGQALTGPGTFGFEGDYGSTTKVTCLSGGSGAGFVLFTVPTAAGPQRIKDKITYTFGPAEGDLPAVGGWEGPRTEGRFVVLPTKGDCVTAPVEQLRGMGSFVVDG